MSQFKTLAMSLIFAWTSTSLARLPGAAEVKEALATRVERRASVFKAGGLANDDALQAAIDAENKSLPKDQQLRLAENTDECRPVEGPRMSKRTLLILFAGAMACLTFAASQAPVPAPVNAPTTIESAR
jgi:hypothetical protein